MRLDKVFNNKKNIIIGVIVIVVIILFATSFRTIQSGEVGIRVRFGKVVNNPTSEGVNFKIPFIEKIEKMNIRVQKIEVKTSSSSKDLQEVDNGIK